MSSFAFEGANMGGGGGGAAGAPTFAEVITALNSGVTDAVFSANSGALKVTAPTVDESAIIFSSTGTTNTGGRIFEIQAALQATDGSMPFVFGAYDFPTNDDTSRDYVFAMGHGFDAAGALVAGAKWGACGLVFEQHFKPGGGTNQSESYFRIWSCRTAGGPQQYRPFSITHVNHHLTDGLDYCHVGVSGQEILFTDDEFGERGRIDVSGFKMASGMNVSFAGGLAIWNGTTGLMTNSCVNNIFNPTLTADSQNCIHLSPVINGAGVTMGCTNISPTWTGAGGSVFIGHRSNLNASKSIAIVLFADADMGATGSGVTVGSAIGYRSRIQAAGSGTVTVGYGFMARSPINSATLSGCYGVYIENHTGFHAFQGGTGKYVFGDASANTLIGFHAAAPIAQQTVAAAGSDAGTTQTLANSLRTILINLGLAKA